MMEEPNANDSCLTCNNTFNADGCVGAIICQSNDLTSVASVVEKTLLLEHGKAALSEDNCKICNDCLALFRQLFDLEQKCVELRYKIWALYEESLNKRNKDVRDVIYGVEVQTENFENGHYSDTHDYTDCEDNADDFPSDGVKLERLDSDSDVSPDNDKSWNSDLDEPSTEQEIVTVVVDPQLDEEDSKWPRWKRRPIACRYCIKWFKSKREVEQHVIEKHPNHVNEGLAEKLQQGVKRKDATDSRRKQRFAKDKKGVKKVTYQCRICDKILKSKPGAIYHAKSHNHPTGSKLDLQMAFRISFTVTDEAGNEAVMTIGEDQKEDATATLLIVESSDASTDDEIPLSEHRKDLIVEKIKQEVLTEPKVQESPRKALQSLRKNSNVQVTKVREPKQDKLMMVENMTDDETNPQNQKDLDDVMLNIKNENIRSKITDLVISNEVTIHQGERPSPQRKMKVGLPRVVGVKKPREPFPLIREPKYKCDVCDKLWKTKGELNAHRATHSDARPFICEICGQAYKHKPALDVHVSMHKGIFQHQCPYCQKAFTQKGALQRHLPIHTGDLPYQCELCGKRFVHRTSFSIHTMAHTGVRNIRCEVCNMGVLSKSHLRRHMRIHTGEKPYECSTCGKSFAERYNLVAHQRIHDPNLVGPARNQKRKPQVCRLCSAVFDRRQKLEEHMVQVHNKIVEDSSLTSRFDGGGDQFVSPRYVLNSESNASSKGGDSQHSDEGKDLPSVDLSMRGMPGLRGIDLLRSSIDSSRGLELIRVASGLTEAPHHWPYMNTSS